MLPLVLLEKNCPFATPCRSCCVHEQCCGLRGDRRPCHRTKHQAPYLCLQVIWCLNNDASCEAIAAAARDAMRCAMRPETMLEYALRVLRRAHDVQQPGAAEAEAAAEAAALAMAAAAVGAENAHNAAGTAAAAAAAAEVSNGTIHFETAFSNNNSSSSSGGSSSR